MPIVAEWLAKANDQDRDHFRDSMTSITNYYKSRKGPRSDYTDHFKFKDPSFAERMKQAAEKESEFLTQTMNQYHDFYATTQGVSNTSATRHPNPPATPKSAGGARARDSTFDAAPFSARPYTSQGPSSAGGAAARPLAATAKLGEIAAAEARAQEEQRENDELSDKLLSHYSQLLKPGVRDSIRTWVSFCSASNKRRLEYVLHAIKKTQATLGSGGPTGLVTQRSTGGGGSAAAPARQHMAMYETTTQSSNVTATRGFVGERGEAVDPHNMVSLYAGNVLAEGSWPAAAAWLALCTPAEVDKFRDCMSSLSSFHKERKGPRSTFHDNFKVMSRRKREALSRAGEIVTRLSHSARNPLTGEKTERQGEGAASARPTLPSLEEATARANQVLGQPADAAPVSTRRVAFGDSTWEDTPAAQRTFREYQPSAANASAKPSVPKLAVPKFARPEQESNLGPIRRHGGFFARTEYQRTLKKHPIAGADEIALKIKAKNSRGNDPLSTFSATGMPESTYRATFKGVRGEISEAVKAEFYE